jgi:predicted flap endonuclease-1-like 5' DNA nuclease
VLAQAGIVAAAIVVVVAALPLMDRMTVDSMTPRPADLPAVDSELAAALGAHGIRDVAEMPAVLADSATAASFGIDPARRRRLAGQVDLALLRGIGAPNAGRLAAVGIDDPADLALTDDTALASWLTAADPAFKARPQRLRVWVSAARREAAGHQAD